MSLAQHSCFSQALTAETSVGLPRAMAIHRANRNAALVESLSTSFPATTRLVGPAYFRTLALKYVAAEPPRCPVLHEYGADFAAYIANDQALAEFPYIADVARIEWAWQCAYHAADMRPIGVDALAGWSDAALLAARIRLSPSLSLIRSPFPAASIWHLQHSGSPQMAIADWTGEAAIVVRPHLDVRVEIIGPAMAVFLEQLGRDSTLAEALDAVLEGHPDADPAGLIHLLLAKGLIVAIEGEKAS